MTSFSNKILKANSVSIDKDNKVLINTGSAVMDYIANNEDTGEEPGREREAQHIAFRIIRQAEKQAEDIVSQARVDAAAEQDAIRKKAEAEAANAYSEAKNSGYKEGMDTAIREGDAIIAAAKKLRDDAAADKQEMEDRMEPDMVNLIISITEKLLGDTVNLNPAIIVNLIKQGLASTSITGDVAIYVSQHDYDTVMERRDEILTQADGSVRLEVKKDLSLNPMDCVIETPFGHIDCSLDQQYESLRQNLTYILSNK